MHILLQGVLLVVCSFRWQFLVAKSGENSKFVENGFIQYLKISLLINKFVAFLCHESALLVYILKIKITRIKIDIKIKKFIRKIK